MRFLYLLALIAGTASMNAALAAHGNEMLMPQHHANDERSFDPTIQPDGRRNPTGEGVGTSTGTPSDMGPDNTMQIKDATRDDRPGVGINPEPPTPPQGQDGGEAGTRSPSQPSR